MDLSKVKNGNDVLMQMWNENQAAEAQDNLANVDNQAPAGVDADNSVVQTTDTIVNDTDSDLELNQVTDTTTDDFLDLDDPAPAVQQAEPKFDFSSLGKALELDGVDSQDALVGKVKEISQKAKEYEGKLAAYSSIPEPLKEAIELANKGGDYLEYLGVSTINYDDFDDRSLVEEELIELGIFNNADGSVNEDALAEYVDGLNDKELRVKGAQVRNRFKQEQASQRQALQKKAEEQKVKAIETMRATLDKVNNIGPFKLNQSRKKELLDSFSSGQMMKELFQDSQGRFDYAKAIQVYYRTKYGDKVEKLAADYVRSKTIKEQANEIRNVDLSQNNRVARPTVQTDTDPMDYFLNKLKGNK
jgi:hypothetical protein